METDSSSGAQALTMENVEIGRAGNLLQKRREWGRKDWDLNVLHIHREVNQCANLIYGKFV